MGTMRERNRVLPGHNALPDEGRINRVADCDPSVCVAAVLFCNCRAKQGDPMP